MSCTVLGEMLLESIRSVIENTKCDCVALSAGIDTALIAAISAKISGVKLKGFVAYYRNGVPRDLPYAIHIAKVLGLDLAIVEITDDDIVRIYPKIIDVVRRGGHEDYIELRNDIVFYRTLEETRKSGCRCVYIGSGGDEIFAGYQFMYGTLLSGELDECRRRWAYGRFPELEIAKIVGMEVVAPYLHNSIRNMGLATPVECLREGISSGKRILRELLRDLGMHIVAERVKTPAESGAGTDVIDRNYVEKLSLVANNFKQDTF